MHILRSLLTSVTLLIVACPTLLGQMPGKAAHTDFLGDPLPEGALMRVGTTRLRHLDSVRQLVFTSDNKHLASLGSDHEFILWELATGKEIRRVAAQEQIRDLPLFEDLLIVQQFQPRLNRIAMFQGGFAPGMQAPPPCVLSANGKFMALSDSSKVRITETMTGKEIARLGFKEPGSTVLALSPDGKSVARLMITEDRGCEVALLQASDGRQLHKLRVQKGRLVMEACFSPDGHYLTGTDQDGMVNLWNVKTGKRLHIFQTGNQQRSFPAVAFAPGGKMLASANQEGIFLWEAGSDEELASFPMQQNGALALAFSPDGATLASSGKGNDIFLWDIASKTLKKQITGPSTPISALAFSADGALLAVGSMDGTLRLWDPQGGKEMTPFQHRPPSVPLSYLTPGFVLLQEASEGNLQYLNDVTGKIARTVSLPENVRNLAVVAPNGKVAALFDAQNESPAIRLWDVEAKKEGRTLEGHTGPILNMTFSPDSLYLVSSSADSSVRVWNTSNGKEVQRFALPGLAESLARVQYYGTGLSNQQTIVSPDNRFVVFLDNVGPALLWEIASGKERTRLRTAAGCSRLVLSPNGRWIATSRNDDTVSVWDTARGKMLHGFVGQDGEIASIAFSPSSKLLATGSGNGAIVLYDVVQGKETRRFIGQRGAVSTLLFSPQGNTLLSAARDGTLLFWNVNAPLPAPAPKLDRKESHLTDLWVKLGNADAGEAHEAICELLDEPAATVQFFRKRLKPVPVLPSSRIQQMIEQLDSEHFLIRDRATQELARLDVQIVPALLKASANKASAETVRRIHQILDKLDGQRNTPENLTQMRAVEILERIGSQEALSLLETLAGGAPHARLTTAAREASQRFQGVP